MCKPQRIFSATPNSEEMELLRTLFEPQDRKSTRLNSSHGYISYAVFCLKKKNNADLPRIGVSQQHPKYLQEILSALRREKSQPYKPPQYSQSIIVSLLIIEKDDRYAAR